jgi:hypothetical protein
MSRTIRLASLAAATLTVAAAAACSDGATAPAVRADAVAQPAASRIFDGGPTLLVNYGDIRIVNGQGIPQAGLIHFTNLQNNHIVKVIDNQTGDLAPEVGRVRVRLPWLTGTNVRVNAYMDAPYSRRGFTERAMVAHTTDFGTLAVHYRPMLHATLTHTDANLPTMGGGIRVVSASNGQLLAHVLDNQAGDLDPALGRIQAYYDWDGQVKVTENPVPPGLAAPSNWQFTVQLPFSLVTSQVHSWTWAHTLLPQPT